MFFSTSPLPFCRQLINTKQSGDIEVAIRNIKSSVGRALAKLTPKELEAYEMGISDRNNKIFDAEDKNPNYYNKKKSGKRKMDGGKIYASMDKKYGGGIFPRKGKM